VVAVVEVSEPGAAGGVVQFGMTARQLAAVGAAEIPSDRAATAVAAVVQEVVVELGMTAVEGLDTPCIGVVAVAATELAGTRQVEQRQDNQCIEESRLRRSR